MPHRTLKDLEIPLIPVLLDVFWINYDYYEYKTVWGNIYLSTAFPCGVEFPDPITTQKDHQYKLDIKFLPTRCLKNKLQ